jgi:hypothetical protein
MFMTNRYIIGVLTTVILVFIGNNIFSQRSFIPGYIVTRQNDTIHGFIDNKSSFASLKVCLFKKTDSDTIAKFTANDINSYRFDNGKYFVSYKLVDFNFKEPVFFEFLLKGKLNLYRTIALDSTSAFFVKKDSLLVNLVNEETTYTDSDGKNYLSYSELFKGQLIYLMKEYPELQGQINQLNNILYANQLIKISRKYHNLSCPGEECIEYSKRTKSVICKVGIGLNYGYPNLYLDKYIRSLSLKGYYMFHWDFTNNFFYGLSIPLEVNFNDFSRKVNILITPAFSKTHFGSDISWNGVGSSVNRNTINISLESFHLPVCFKYSFNSSHWKIWPFLGLGFQYMRFIKHSMDFHYYIDSSEEQQGSDFQFSSFQNSLFAISGIDLPFKTKKISFFLKYEVGDGIHRLKYLDSFLKISKTNMFSFGGALFF